MKSVFYAVLLNYDITFDDADDGKCFAGEAFRVLTAFMDKQNAVNFIQKWENVFLSAELEKIIIPVQPNNSKLRKEFGFDLHSFSQNEENYKLSILEIEAF